MSEQFSLSRLIQHISRSHQHSQADEKFALDLSKIGAALVIHELSGKRVRHQLGKHAFNSGVRLSSGPSTGSEYENDLADFVLGACAAAGFPVVDPETITKVLSGNTTFIKKLTRKLKNDKQRGAAQHIYEKMIVDLASSFLTKRLDNAQLELETEQSCYKHLRSMWAGNDMVHRQIKDLAKQHGILIRKGSDTIRVEASNYGSNVMAFINNWVNEIKPL